MNETQKLVSDVVGAGVKALTQPTRPPQTAPSDPRVPKFHKENAVVGVTLNDYTDREPSEDGKYVKVTIHREHIELIEQPPTPEELAREKENREHNLKIAAILGASGVAALMVYGVIDVAKARVRSAG